MSALPLLRRRRERRSIERQRSQGRLTRGAVGVGLLLAIFIGCLIVGGAFVYASVTSDLPSLDLLPQLLDSSHGSLLTPTRIYDRTGTHLLSVLAPQDATRLYAPIEPDSPDHIPDTLIRATVALLDPGFYTHPGYVLEDLNKPDEHPTLAQKLAADLLLWNEAPGLRRAIRERILAAQMTARFGRDQVLEWYLNSANYGRFTYGASNASHLYFGKSVSQLNLAEAALLASVNLSPAINPLDAPQGAIQRALDALNVIQAGGMATSDEVLVARFIPLSFQPAPAQISIAPTFTALALSQLESRFNRARAERGGMVIVTTLDFDLQQRASCAAQTQLAHLSSISPQPCVGADSLPPLPPGQDVPNAAANAVVLDPRSGQVLALVGDSRFGSESAFLTPRRPGTLLTPFVVLAGFTRGLSPATLAWDIPPAGTAPAANVAYHGPIRLREALTNDYLISTSQIFDQMGAALVQQTMASFGLNVSAGNLKELVQTENRYSVIDMAQAYGVFAAQGTLIGQSTTDGLAPSAVLAVKGADGLPYADWSVPSSEQIVSGQLAYLLTDVLGISDLGRPAAFKPGQMPDGADTWAVGYSPHRVVAVWMGGEGLSQRPAQGLWTSIMQSASRDVPPDGWPLPAGVLHLKVCDPSGLLPTDACPNVVDEVFIDGYQPVQADTLYHSYAVNRETGFLATVFTPLKLVEQRVYMDVPPEAQEWAKLTGLPAPPAQYDTIQVSAPNPNANITSPAMFAGLSGKVTISGTAGGQNFAYYHLQYGQGLNPETWVQIGADGNTPVKAGNLAEWDTSGLQGLYALQLLVVGKDNSLQTATVQVTIK
jgi:membrane peptidoglycan carboxypeptidase